jgi:hypothetical protein
MGAFEATSLTLLLCDQQGFNLIGVQILALPIDAVLKLPVPPVTDFGNRSGPPSALLGALETPW